jgi:hypothetical protein
MEWKSLQTRAFIFGLLTLALTFYGTEWYREQYFSYRGEAYLKGAGHLLREDFRSALLFLIPRHFLGSGGFFILLFLYLGPETGKTGYRLFRYVALATLFFLLAYTVYQVMHVVSGAHEQADRIIEIALTWFLRIAGFFIGYRLANTVWKHTPQQK